MASRFHVEPEVGKIESRIGVLGPKEAILEGDRKYLAIFRHQKRGIKQEPGGIFGFSP